MLTPQLAGVSNGSRSDELVSVLHLSLRDLVATPEFSDSENHSERDCPPRIDGYYGGRNRGRHCVNALGQAVRWPYQSSNDVHILSSGQCGPLGCSFLWSCAIRWRSVGSRNRYMPVARRTRQRNGSLCGDTPRKVRKRRCVRCRSSHLLQLDAHCPVRLKSRTSRPIHTVFRRCTLRNFYHVRDPALRNEHESCANTWSRITRSVLARTLGLFPGAYSGHVGRF